MESKILGYIFKELRYQRGLTLRQVSERVDIDFSYLSKIETGVSVIQRHQFVALARFYGIKRDQFDIKCNTFFGDLKEVLNANLQHNPEREKISLSFLDRYKHLYSTHYLPYLHFVELENLSYSGKRNNRFYYLIDTLREDVLSGPYDYFFMLRKLYWACQQHDDARIKNTIPIIEEMTKKVDKRYRPYGYYYLLTGYVISGDNVKITRLYDLTHSGMMGINNLHFAMLADTMYGAYLVLRREYRHSIKFNKRILTNENYQLSKFSKKSINFNIAEAYLQLNEFSKAFDYYQKSFSFVPQKSTIFFLAYCKYCLGVYQDGVKIINDLSKFANKDLLFDQLLLWFKKYLSKGQKDKYIAQVENIEAKFKDNIDYSLRVVLLRIKIDHCQKNGDVVSESRYLRQLVEQLQSI